MILMFLGTQCPARGDSARAREFLERAVSMAEVTLRADHPNIPWFVKILAVPVEALRTSDAPASFRNDRRASQARWALIVFDGRMPQDLAGTLRFRQTTRARSRYEVP
jgi:hypothetical protein